MTIADDQRWYRNHFGDVREANRDPAVRVRCSPLFRFEVAMAVAGYTMLEVMGKTGIKSKGTLVRLEKKGVFPKPKRRARDNARIYTDDHVAKIEEYWNKTQEADESPHPTHMKKKK